MDAMNDADRGSMVKKGHRSDVSFGSIVSKTAVRAWRGSSECAAGRGEILRLIRLISNSDGTSIVLS